MPVADKYRLNRQIGWSEEAEVHSGPVDPARGVPIAVKIRHGLGGPPRPDGVRERFLRAAQNQQAATEAGCRQIAPIFEMGQEDGGAFYASRLYPRSLDSLIQGRVALEATALYRIADGVLRALEELRDRHGRAHGNLKPSNVFLDGKNVQSSTPVLGDLAMREVAISQGADCHALGAAIYQLVRGRTVRNIDWPIVHTDDWARLGPRADTWRGFCNALMAPELSAQPDALAQGRKAFKNMRRLGAAAGKERAAAGAKEGGKPAPRPRKGLFALIGAGVMTLAGAAGLVSQPPDSKLGKTLRALPVLASFYQMIDVPRPSPTPAPTPKALNVPGETPGVSPAPGELANGQTPAPSMPEVAVETPPPTPEATPTPATPDPRERWNGYIALLEHLRGLANDPNAAEQPQNINSNLARLRDSVGFTLVKDEPTVIAFLNALPPKIEATGLQADLPANLWTKQSGGNQDDVQSVTYQLNGSSFAFQFIRVSDPANNQPPFFLSATAVPVQFGIYLLKVAERDGKGPFSGSSSPKGPVSWEGANGNYVPRRSWLVLDSVNSPFYASAGGPTGASPMNGLSAIEAVRLARAVGCTLPTLAQWNATLASPSGQEWVARWQGFAKVRSPQWSAFAKDIQNRHITGAKLPNDQCFGDKVNLEAVTTAPDQNLFFEPVNTRLLKGFSHLIGNVGQYVVDDANNPTKYYFAGGSAETAPSAFQSLTAPPPVVSPFLAAADGGLRLVARAKGNGSEKNEPLETLRTKVAAELARAQKLAQ